MPLQSEQASNEAPAIYYLTSGASGITMLAMLSHHNLVMQYHTIYQDVPCNVVRESVGCPASKGSALFGWTGTTTRYGQP
ncbi:hypothetical protein PG993_008802 [Apiospora rasikravindrae]|uniref:Uncharacterized protein n=1 Tax=Apiospora rasikravindrae TaxID=990691 RepID=A0ABR1SPE2_9PEZI